MDNDISNFMVIADEAQRKFKISRSTANSYAIEVIKLLDKLRIKDFYCSI